MKRKKIIIAWLAVFIFLSVLCFELRAEHYAEKYGWYFRNFKDPTLSWEIYRDSFIGIPPQKSASPLDILFYETIYKSELSKPGNCFGMSLMSLMMISKGGYLGYCLPIPQYSGGIYTDTGPTDKNLRYAINQMHGHQVSLPALSFVMKIIADGNRSNGKYAYNQVIYYKKKEDPTLISISKNVNPGDGAHTMVAYDAKTVSGKMRIYLYDPNRTWADSTSRNWYENHKNYIEIDNLGNWKFEKTTDKDPTKSKWWSGGPSTVWSGHILVFPISIVGPTARVPSSLGLNVITKIKTIFISGDSSEVTQVTNPQGKRLFIPGTKAVDINPATGMVYILPWAPSGGGTGKCFYFVLGGSDDSLDIDINCKKGDYQLGVFGEAGYLSVRSHEGIGRESFTIENIGSTEPSVLFSNQAGARSYDMEFYQVPGRRNECRIFRLYNLKVSPDAAVIVQVTRNQEALEVSTTQSAVQYDLELTNVVDQVPTVLRKSQIHIPAGRKHFVRPENWDVLKSGQLHQDQESIAIDQVRLKPLHKRKK